MRGKKIFLFLYLLFSVIINNINGQSNNILENRLVKYYYLAQNSVDSNLYKIRFFHVFPDNFYLFESIYGYDEHFGKYWIDSTLEYPLFNVAQEHIDLLFSCTNLIEKNSFYRKMINISISGYAQVDAITFFQYNLQKLVNENRESFFKVLNGYADTDIKSFWHFYFDIWDYGLHRPSEEEYNIMIKELPNTSRISNLMKEQYQDDYNHYMKLKKEEFKDY